MFYRSGVNNVSEGESKQINKKLVPRRKFLTKSAAAVVVGSIPSRSIWANGITNSIVASGNGSDFAGGRDIKLLSACSLLNLLKRYQHAYLDQNFSLVFDEGPNQSFSEILSCHCSCPKEIRHGISNVVYLVQFGEGHVKCKIDSYGGDVKNPNDPTRYIYYLESTQYPGGKVVDYVIKAGQKYYNPMGMEVSPDSHSWYRGHSGKSIDDEIEFSKLTSGISTSFSGICEVDEVTIAMIAMYLNARFDYYFRNGRDVSSWDGFQGIYYPILKSERDVVNLVISIKSSKRQLVSILETYSEYGVTPACESM